MGGGGYSRQAEERWGQFWVKETCTSRSYLVQKREALGVSQTRAPVEAEHAGRARRLARGRRTLRRLQKQRTRQEPASTIRGVRTAERALEGGALMHVTVEMARQLLRPAVVGQEEIFSPGSHGGLHQNHTQWFCGARCQAK